MTDEERYDGITRREVLKKGAILGGALVWATPMVQTVGMAAAGAQTAPEPSPRECAFILSYEYTTPDETTSYGTGPVPAGLPFRFSWIVCNCGTVALTPVRVTVKIDGITEALFNHGRLTPSGSEKCGSADGSDGPLAAGNYTLRFEIEATSEAPGNPVVNFAQDFALVVS